MISESALHAKVQHEMSAALEVLRKRQAREIQELLDFLEESRINASPMESSQGMMSFIDNLPYPSFIMSPAMGIMKANVRLADILGWEFGELDGRPAIDINDAAVMSSAAPIAFGHQNLDKKQISLRYVYLHKDGTRIYGNLHVIKLPDGAYFMVFHPDSENVLNDHDLTQILDSSSSIHLR